MVDERMMRLGASTAARLISLVAMARAHAEPASPVEACVSPAQLVHLDFGAASITPNSDVDRFKETYQELRYVGVATLDGKSVDLVIDETSPSVRSACTEGIACTGRLSGGFGSVAWRPGNDNYYLDNLRFRFEFSASAEPAVLPAFYFTFLDIDSKERVFVSPSTAPYWLSEETQAL